MSMWQMVFMESPGMHILVYNSYKGLRGRVVRRDMLSSHCCLRGHWASWSLGNLQLSAWVITSSDLGHPGCFRFLGCSPSPTQTRLTKSYATGQDQKQMELRISTTLNWFYSQKGKKEVEDTNTQMLVLQDHSFLQFGKFFFNSSGCIWLRDN